MKNLFLKKNRVLASALIVTLGASLLLSACGSSSESTEEESVQTEESADASADVEETSSEETEYKYGTLELPVLDGSLCWSPAILAVELGYFADEGFDVTLTTSDIEANKIALNEGSVPIILGDFQYFPSIEAGVEISVVAGLHMGCIKLVVLPDSDIETAEDLEGATIGVDAIGGTTHMVTSLWLEQAGISADTADGEVSFVAYTDGNLQLEALYSGEIDVAAVWDPFGTTSSEAGDTRVILDIGTDEPFAGKYCCFVYASNAVLEEDPEQVEAALRALEKAQEYIVENTEEAVEIVLNSGYISTDDAEGAEELLLSYDFCAMEDEDDAQTALLENVEYFASALYEIGYLETESDEFVENAYFDLEGALGQ